MDIGFTGTREGMTDRQRTAFKALLIGHAGPFHHGDCVGADEQAAGLARDAGLRIIGHPPTDGRLRAHYPSDENFDPRPYLDRNRDIVDASRVVIAAPKEMAEAAKGGTWATIRYARKRGVALWVVLPDGTVRDR